MSDPRGRYSRGYLPHIDAGPVCQFLTWRLDDAVPGMVVERWREELAGEPEEIRRRKLWKRVEDYCDSGHGACYLRNPLAAKVVQDALLFHHGKQYELKDWAVMPNHVHVLLIPFEGVSLEEIEHSQKSYTSNEINRILHRRGRLWQPEAFDRMIRNEAHFERTSQYIRHNPVKAKLCADSRLYPYSSANPKVRERLFEARE